MRIIFRTSEHITYKKKLNRNPIYCLKNALKNFPNCTWNIILDNVSLKTKKKYEDVINKNCIISINENNNSNALMHVLQLCLDLKINQNFKKIKENEIIYFLENDYIHIKNSKLIMLEGFDLNADYISLYDHPDKYYLKKNNIIIKDQLYNNETSKVLLSNNCHWKTTHSTTMTFAVKKNILSLDFGIFQKLLKRSIPRDKRLFEQLSKKGRTLITPIPSYSTHIEREYLAPQRTWK